MRHFQTKNYRNFRKLGKILEEFEKISGKFYSNFLENFAQNVRYYPEILQVYRVT